MSQRRDQHGEGDAEADQASLGSGRIANTPATDSWFRQVLETAQEGIWTVNTLGRTTFANQRMADIVGRSIEEFIGVSAFDCIAPEALEDALAGFGRNFSSDTRLPITTRLLRPDGTEVAVRMAATPLRGDGDVIVGGLVLVTDLSAQRQTQEEITLREAWLDAILHDAFDLVVAISTEGLITFATPITFEILGLDEAQVIGSRPLSFVHHDDIEEAAGAFGHALSGSHLRDPFQCRIRRGDGIYVWFEFTATNLIENSAVAVILHGRNVTDRIEASEQLARKEAWLDAILHQAFDVVVAVTAEGMVTFATANIESFLLRSMDTFLGTNLLDAVDPDDRAVASAILATVMSEPGASESARFRVLRADGSSLWIEAKITNLLLDPAVEQIIINARDITERHLADTKIAYHAMHDALTGLPNRYLLGDRLHHAMARRGRLGSNLAVVFIDLDHFKVLNDSSGHAVGDSALCEVAARLRKVCRSGDTVARFGGDEFVLISENIASLHEGREVGERVLRAVTDAPFEASHGRVFLSVSVGVAVGDAEISVDRLLADADTAMYRAKTLGRSRVEVFDPSMRAAVPP